MESTRDIFLNWAKRVEEAERLELEIQRFGGKYLLRYRKALGWTLEQMGRETGFHISTISKIETGVQPLTRNIIKRVAAIRRKGDS